MIGADGAIAGWTGLVEWRAPDLAGAEGPRLRAAARPDGRDVHSTDAFDWEAARALSAENTRLRPGDLLVGPVLELHERIESGGFVV